MALRLLGVYNADGSVRGELAYLVGRLRGTAHCALCDITHGRLRRRPDFDAACRQLSVPIELYHRDEIDQSLIDVIDGRYPCILVADPHPEMLLEPDDIEGCAGDPAALVGRITQALTTRE